MNNLIPDWAREHFALNYAMVDDKQVPFLVGGAGPPLLLIHGLSASLDWWQYNANELAASFTVYMVDLPGFGRMGQMPATESMSRYAGWMVRFMDAAGLERIHALGHSMGGHIAARLAAAHPERVDRLVLAAPAGVLPDAELEHYALPVIKLLREIPPRMLPLALRDIRRADLRTAWRTGQDLVEHDVLEMLPLIQAPTLLIWGDDDPVTPYELSETFQEQIPNSRLITLNGAGHLSMIDQAAAFNRHVLEFLRADQE